MADDLARFARVDRTISCAHVEAFQLMLYRADDGEEVWFWNSRDGVTPFGTAIDGKEFRHAMHGYSTRYTAILPAGARFVWVSYTPASWEAQMRLSYERALSRPVPADWEGPTFAESYPTVEAYLAIRPFEGGQPRQITREEFLASTPEWMGKHADG
jgi:hypothetical protein